MVVGKCGVKRVWWRSMRVALAVNLLYLPDRSGGEIKLRVGGGVRWN